MVSAATTDMNHDLLLFLYSHNCLRTCFYKEVLWLWNKVAELLVVLDMAKRVIHFDTGLVTCFLVSRWDKEALLLSLAFFLSFFFFLQRCSWGLPAGFSLGGAGHLWWSITDPLCWCPVPDGLCRRSSQAPLASTLQKSTKVSHPG